MTLTAAVLIIISALMHAFWNLIGKRQQASLAYFSVTTIAVSLLTAPLLYHFRQAIHTLTPPVWFLIAATGLAQTVYFLGLTNAYRQGDISLVYPLARALPILMVVAVSFAIGRGDSIGLVGLTGMFLVVLGCFILPLPNFRQFHLKHYLKHTYLMVLVTAVGTTGYTLLDDEALRQMRHSAELSLSDTEVTLLFIPLQVLSTAVMMTLAALLIKRERAFFRPLLTRRRLLVTAVFTGLIIMSTYGLVLASMAYVTNVSYVAAFRQLSIPLGAFFGITLLKEPRPAPKLVGVLIISAGLILVGIG